MKARLLLNLCCSFGLLLGIPVAKSDQLQIASGLYDFGLNQFHDVQVLTPANPYDLSIENIRSDVFDLSDPGTSPMIGSFTAYRFATYGTLKAEISGDVSGSDTFPKITMYASSFFFDSLTFHTTAPGGTAYLKVSVDGSGTVPNPPGTAPGVYGNAYTR